MSHFILLPATGQEYDAPVFVTALAAARLLDGHLAFLHVRPDLQRQIAGSSAGDFGLGTSMDNTFEEMEKDADAREQAAVQIWKDFCEEYHFLLVGPQSKNKEGWVASETELVAAIALRAA